MMSVIQVVIALVYVVAAVVVLYRIVNVWLTHDGFDAMAQMANALNAVVVFAALMILHAVAAAYGVAPFLKLP